MTYSSSDYHWHRHRFKADNGSLTSESVPVIDSNQVREYLWRNLSRLDFSTANRVSHARWPIIVENFISANGFGVVTSCKMADGGKGRGHLG